MDALTRRQFDRAMFAKERTLAIRVGDYASRDIKEASFEYGYIKGDTYKPGGTCAGSGKITFTSIITTFNKLDILHPEIGLLVGNAYQWVKMGEYFINDIEIDRNRNTTTLELMDGMFKLNREYVTDLHFPAEVREVIQEICLKTGIELANDYFGISAMRYHVEQVPEGKKLSFRDMLSAMTQMIGMSCFFNREGKMEIRDLTESNITINADSYFLHGLTKSEIEYQIAGITCKTDKKPLTVGMKTGRSLELDNVFMTQSALNDLYYKLKNLTYYPYNLNYQGHLLLEVGQWVTIQTNKKETFKVPVLSQSFTFKGGLRGRISADSKAGNDTQYSYEGTITKQIKQQDGIEAKIQAQIEAADAAFDAEFKKRKKEIDDGIELAKAKVEEVKQDISNEIDKRFQNFDNASIQEARRKAEEALKSAGVSASLAQEAKKIGEQARADITNLQVSSQNSLSQIEAFKTQYGTKLNEFKNTADGLSTKMGAVETYISNDGQRQEELKHYARTESASQVSAVREQISRDYVGKLTYQEDIRGLERRFSAISTQTDNDIATKIAQYKQTVDGQFASITSQIAGKASQADFQRVKETSQLYERILGNTENGIADKVARMAMTNQLFQVEVGKAFAEHQNLFLNSTLTKGFLGNNGIIYVANATQKEVTSDFISVDPNEKIIFQHWVTLPENGTAWSAWQFFDKNKNPIDNRKPGLNAYKTTVGKQHNINQITVPANAYFVRFSARMYDDGLMKVEKGSAPSDYSVAPNDALEAVKTVQRQLAGSWAVQNLTSAGSIVSQINATNNQILVEAEKIRFKGKTLADQLTAIDGYFKRLFVGEGNFATLNTEVLKSNSITADKLVMDMAMARRFVSSDIFTNTLASKTAFINQLQSVIVSSTLLEGYKGWIGGFQIGTHNSGSGRWITGRNQFAVGIGDGEGGSGRTALWVNWGYSWNSPGTEAWFVKNNGKMYCYNTAEFWSTPVVHGDLKVTGRIRYDGGAWVYSNEYEKIGRSSTYYFYLEKTSGGRDYFLVSNDTSDRRLKSNIQESSISGIDIINRLKTYSYRKEFNNEVEDISCGIMAQDVQKYAPDAFRESPDGVYTYNTFALVPYLIKAIQELNQKVEKMEKIIA